MFLPLGEYFTAVEIPKEKNPCAYGDVCSKYRLTYADTWMIGNSPKSDINPALAADLNAVFVPHDDTWVLEHEELAEAKPPRRLLRLSSFAELVKHF